MLGEERQPSVGFRNNLVLLFNSLDPVLEKRTFTNRLRRGEDSIDGGNGYRSAFVALTLNQRRQCPHP